jgi:tetratricopeptide (TPR) repeat protein
MEALAVYGRPVPSAAVDYLLLPHVPGVDSAPVLGRLVNLQLVRKEADRYYLHPIDRAYALSRVNGEEEIAERAMGGSSPPFSRATLRARAADFYRRVRLPEETWKRFDDLEPLLSEFDLRCDNGEYDTAAGVLFEISGYLDQWGEYRLAAALHERLLGRLVDLRLARANAVLLGGAYVRMGQFQLAADCYEQGLSGAREARDHWAECTALNGLGACLAELGQVDQAISHLEQGLTVCREVGDVTNEAVLLGNLGSCYRKQGLTDRAVECHEQVLGLDRARGLRLGEAEDLVNLSSALISAGRFREAAERGSEAGRIALELGNQRLGGESANNRTVALLLTGDLPAASAAAAEAAQFDDAKTGPNAAVLMGALALHQGDLQAAHTSFSDAVARADALLASDSRSVAALDTKGLALCGLTICGDDSLAAATEVFRAARARNKDEGVVRGVLLRFDMLAREDSAGVLAAVRPVAAGELATTGRG